MSKDAKRYHIIEAMGSQSIHKAYDNTLNRVVMIKTLAKEEIHNLPNLIEEAKVTAQLQHPNIVQVYDIIQEEGHYYIAMEYVEGKFLAEILQEQLPDHETTAKIILQIAEAISYAHSEKVVHQNLTPWNIIVTTDNTAKIINFGLAQTLGTTSFRETVSKYLAPEIQQNKQAGGKTDVYGIGVLLYEMLMGFSSFRATAIHSTPRNNVPKELYNIYVRCLQKRPSARYRSIKGICRDLQDWLGEKSLSSSGLNRSTISSRLPRKRSFTFPKFYTGVIVLVGLFSVAFYHLQQNEKQLLSEIKKLEDTLVQQQSTVKIRKIPDLLEIEISTNPTITWDNTPESIILSIDKYEFLAKRFPENPILYQKWGEVLWIYAFMQQQKNPDVYLQLAITKLDKAIQLYPKNYYSYFLAHIVQESYLQNNLPKRDYLRTIAPKSPMVALYQETIQCRDQIQKGLHRDTDKFLKLCQTLLERYPTFVWGYRMKAFALYQQHQYPEAIACCEAMLEISPNHPYAFKIAGTVLLKKGDYNNAIDYFSKCIEVAPGFLPAYRGRAKIYKIQKKYDSALKDLLLLLKILDYQEDIAEEVVEIYQAQKKYPQAIQLCDFLIAKNTQNSYFYLAKARIYKDSEQLSEALENYQKAKAYDFQRAKIRMELIDLYRKMGKTTLAEQELEELKQLNIKD